MSLFSQCPSQKMGSAASLHANQLDAPLRCETKELYPRELLAHHNLAA